MERVFQKLIRKIIARSQFENKTASFKIKLRCIICRASSKKNLCPNRRSYEPIRGIHDLYRIIYSVVTCWFKKG